MTEVAVATLCIGEIEMHHNTATMLVSRVTETIGYCGCGGAIGRHENFDVSKVDVETVQLEGVLPLRSSFEDVATPFVSVTSAPDCNELGPDGYMDLTLKFDTQAVVAALGQLEDGDCLVLELTGNLLGDDGGTAFTAEDMVHILKKGNQNASNQNKGKKENGK